LGLDVNVNQKEILKRYKEIITRLKIDDYPEYELDVNLSETFRTEQTASEALKKLQNLKNNIKEYFFWLNISDEIDEKAISYFEFSDVTSFEKTIDIWKNASETENSLGLFYKKNLAIFYCVLMFIEKNDEYLEPSLLCWEELINSKKFWDRFQKSFLINNDQNINSDLIKDFKNNVTKNISDIYHDLYLQHNDSKYIKKFQDKFDVVGDKTTENIIKPIHQSLYDLIEDLKKINFKTHDNAEQMYANQEKPTTVCNYCGRTEIRSSSKKFFDYDDGSILCNQCHKSIGGDWQEKHKTEEVIGGYSSKLKQIQDITSKIDDELEKLENTGLYEEDQSKVIRDHLAQAIRDLAIDIHNEVDMRNRSIELVNLAIEISGTDSLKQNFKSDLNIVKTNIAKDDEDELEFELGGFLRKKNLKVKDTFIEYNSKKIFYKDTTSIGIIVTEKENTILLNSHHEKMKISLPSFDSLTAIYNHIANNVKPIIIKKLVSSIFDNDKIISIGKVNFDKKGFHSTKLFRSKSVFWDNKIMTPVLKDGIVTLGEFKGHAVEATLFETIPIKDLNAVVVPELVETCYQEFHMRNQK